MRIVHAILNFILPCVPAMIAGIASASLSRKSSDEWSLLAWVPPLPLLGFGLFVGVALVRDPTAANLWPIVMVFFAAITAALFGLFLLGRKLADVADSRRPKWAKRRHR